MDPLITAAFLVGLLVGAIVVAFYRRRATEVAIQARAQKLLNTKQEAFIAIASHYLLTPISVIQSAVTRLSEKPNLELSERQKLYNIIVSGEKRLYIITEQLLLAAKLVNGELNLAPKVARLHEPVIEAIREVETIATLKNIAFQSEIKQTPPIEARFDPKQLKTAVVALLDNAIKFSHERSVILVNLTQQYQNAVIQVRDQGIGLTSEQQAHATEKFYRGTPPYVFDYEGMGLGLHVADVIIEAHGGELQIQSAGQNKGTITSLILPLGR